ncbi:BQ5605_C016g08086 [Microbotryum silenes-dioicae]|uniref:BQ5605_C016g08086 protein n=1 Tax=Microbotryum silenes-dioicae TaxID=796604 RepID=A0A2X0NSW7_9BASI|nr:BQ5605_C016g08086 [Microbotryum silenes-dioicae]
MSTCTNERAAGSGLVSPTSTRDDWTRTASEADRPRTDESRDGPNQWQAASAEHLLSSPARNILYDRSSTGGLVASSRRWEFGPRVSRFLPRPASENSATDIVYNQTVARYASTSREPFRKVLYLRQDYPSNYVDSSFLSDLQRNVNVHPASLPVLLAQTLPITQHLASTFIFVSIFVRLSKGSLQPSTLLVYCGVLAVALRVALFVIRWTCDELRTKIPATTVLAGADGEEPDTAPASTIPSPLPTPSTNAKIPIIPLFSLYLLSPALKTLTRATTSDSIWALAGTLFALNVFVGDYRSIPLRTTGSPGKTSSSLPLTAALSGSTVLASRLSSNLAVFSLLLFATIWFGPLPGLRSHLSIRPTLILTLVLCLGAIGSLRGLGGGVDKIAMMLLFASAVLVPLLRGWLMLRYKDRVRGPWDQAVPRVGPAN